MPQIPQYKRNVRPSLDSLPRVLPEAMTQDIAAMANMGGAIAGAGQMGMAFVAQLQESRVTTEVDNAKVAGKKGMHDFLLTLHTLDYKDYDKEYQKAKSSVYDNMALTENGAKAKFDSWWNDYTVMQEFTVSKMGIAEEIRVSSADFYKNINALADMGDVAGIQELTRNVIKSKYVKADVATRAEVAAIGRAEDKLRKNRVDQVWQKMFTVLDRKKAIQIINETEDLSTTDKSGLINRYDQEQRSAKAREVEGVNKAQESWKLDSYKKFRDNTLTFAEIDGSPLSADEKLRWVNWLDKKNKAVVEKTVDPFENTNATIYGRTSERISLNPKSINVEKDIWAFHGKGLSTDSCNKLIGQLKTNTDNPLRGDAAKRTHGLLKQFANSYIFHEDEMENAYIYGEKANALDQFLATDPTDIEVEKFFRELTTEATGSWLNSLWEKMSIGMPGSSSWKSMVKQLSGETTKRKKGESIEDYLGRAK